LYHRFDNPLFPLRKKAAAPPPRIGDALAVQFVAVPARPLSEAFGMFPGLDTSDPRDHEDRL